jgi:hypothetical protein
LEDSLHYDLKVYCVTNKVKIAELVRWLIQQYLDGADVRKLPKQIKKR